MKFADDWAWLGLGQAEFDGIDSSTTAGAKPPPAGRKESIARAFEPDSSVQSRTAFPAESVASAGRALEPEPAIGVTAPNGSPGRRTAVARAVPVDHTAIASPLE